MNDLIEVLKKQHDKLAEYLNQISTGIEQSDYSHIFENTTSLGKDLMEHLELENNTFYPILLENMRKNGQDTTKTELFIAEMKDIEKEVLPFLDKYNSTQKIEENFENFKEEFRNISEALMLRVESENTGVYTYLDYVDNNS